MDIRGALFNKKRLSEGSSVNISTTASGKMSIVSTAEESDSVPDVGSKTLSVSVDKLKPIKVRRMPLRLPLLKTAEDIRETVRYGSLRML